MSKTIELKRKDIRDIPAERIKELMLQHNFENPTETAISIAKASFTFIKNADPKSDLIDADFVNSSYTLERMFDLHVDLMDELQKLN